LLPPSIVRIVDAPIKSEAQKSPHFMFGVGSHILETAPTERTKGEEVDSGLYHFNPTLQVRYIE